MRIETDCARNGSAPPAMTTRRFPVSTDDDWGICGDITRASRRSATANSGVKSPCMAVVIEAPSPTLPAVSLTSPADGDLLGGTDCRRRCATEDSDNDSDSTASCTSDELASQLQQLRFRAGSDKQLSEPLAARGPPDGTATRGGDSLDCQPSTQFSWFPALTDDVAAVSGVRCKRKSSFEPPLVHLHPVSEADASFEAVQPGTDCDGWDAQLPCQQAVKFRRPVSDPPETNDRARLTLDSSLTSTLTSGGRSNSSSGHEEFNFPFDPYLENCLVQHCPEIESKPFSAMNGIDSAPSPPHSDAFQLSDAWKILSDGSLLNQLEAVSYTHLTLPTILRV